MASVHKRKGSPFWWGAFKGPDGRRGFRSTKCKKRADALKATLEWQEASDKRSTEAQIRRVLSDIHKRTHGSALVSASITDYAAQWLARKSGEVGPATYVAYKLATSSFLEQMGDRVHADLASVTPADIARARDHWGSNATPKTANNKLKCIRVLFASAWREGVIADDPARKVQILKSSVSTEKRAFSLDEMKRVLSVADLEWTGMILGGLYTGQRMSDLVCLHWNQVDLMRREIVLTTAKTGRRQITPIAEPLLKWLMANSGDESAGPVFPNLFSKRKSGGVSPLSQAFHNILVSAGLAVPHAAKDKSTGSGRQGRRTRSPLTFHSLRHTATSWLKAAGVSEAIAREIIGHDSAEISRHYTHMTESDKASAIARLPLVDFEAINPTIR